MAKIRGKVKIVSDGTSGNTRITCDDIPIHGVKSITWRCDAPGFGVATLRVEHVEVDVWGRHLGSWKAPAHFLKRDARSRISGAAWHLRAALKTLAGKKF